MRVGAKRCVGSIAPLVSLVACCSFAAGGERAEYRIAVSSFLGGSGFDDAVVGARIQSDGTIVLAANLGADILQRIGAAGMREPAAGGRASGRGGGVVIRLGPDGRKLLSLRPISKELKDMAIDAGDNIYLAAGAEGVIRLSPRSDRVAWTKPVGDCSRVDVAADGHVAAIAGGVVHVLDPRGGRIGRAKGSHYTNDVCIDGASKTVVFCGFRNAKAFDGKKTYPVQICYVRGLSYRGEPKWTDYDWSTDRGSDRFLNKPTNNMADTRADRCSIGRRTRAVFGGSGMPDGMFVKDAVQPRAGDPGKEKKDPRDGFFVVIEKN